MNRRDSRNYTTAMFAPQQPFYMIKEVPTEPLGSFHEFPKLPDHRDGYVEENYFDNQQKYYFTPEHPYNYGSDDQIVYVVQEEPPMSEKDAKELGLYANIMGSYMQNKGKSAATLQADIEYLKKLRQKFPMAKDFLTRQIVKKRELKKVLGEQAQQESIRDKGFTGLVIASVAVLSAISIYTLSKIGR